MKRFLSILVPRPGDHLIRIWMLLLMICAGLVYGASDLVLGLDADLLWPLGITALLLGWLLARMLIPGWRVTIIGALTGVMYAFWGVGRLGGRVLNLASDTSAYIWQAIRDRIIPDASVLTAGLQEIFAGLQVLLSRMYFWGQSLLGSEPAYDPIVSVLVWELAIWGVLIWASWHIRRKENPILATVPAILVLAYSLAFVGGNSNYLLPMLGAMVSLAVFVNHGILEKGWKSEKMEIPPGINRKFTNMAILASVALVTMAAFTPSVSLEDINDFIDDLTPDQEPDLGESIGLEPRPQPVEVSASQSRRARMFSDGQLPRQHLIGSGPELAEQVAMVIQATELKLGLGSDAVEEVPTSLEGYYWRSITYDIYDGRGWSTENIEVETFLPGELSIVTSLPGQHVLRQWVDLSNDNNGLVHVAGKLITMDQSFSAAWRPKTSPPGTRDLFVATIDTTSYVADSLLQVFSQEVLRRADQSYPPEISNYYMDLPRNISDRVIRLAFDLTATQPTAYDRAVAIESYLRTYEYDLDVPVPQFRDTLDLTDYFLFTIKRGYCDYYATAMVVLARLSGLPARFVVGYIGGTYDEEEDAYIVTEDQAHSWVEIYFPEYGWIEFEPTANRPVIKRSSESLSIGLQDFEQQTGFLNKSFEERLPSLVVPRPSYWVIWVVAVATLAVFIWIFLDEWRLYFYAPGKVISVVYARLYRYGGYLRVASHTGKTPYEYADAFFEKFSGLVKKRRNRLALRADREAIDWLTERFSRIRYGQRQADNQMKAQAIKVWRNLRGPLQIARREAWRDRFRRTK